MRSHSSFPRFSVFLLTLLFQPMLFAGVATDIPLGGAGSAKVVLRPVETESPWSIGGGFASRFNIKASFGNLGGGIPGLPLPANGPFIFGDYDDGFVRSDISGDTCLTTFWNYQDVAQYDASNGGSLGLSISSVLDRGSVSERDDAGGIDLFARRTIGPLTFLGKPARWGVQARFNYTHIDIGNGRALSLSANRVTDSFPLEGVIPPLAPYTGSFEGPGPLLGTDASRSTSVISGGALVMGSRELEADLFAFSFGVWSDFSPAERLTFSVEAGVTLAIANGDYSQTSQTAFGGRTITSGGSGSETKVLPGFYVGAGADYAFSENWSLYGGLRYEYLDDFSIRAGGSKADLSFSGSLVASVGVGFKF